MRIDLVSATVPEIVHAGSYRSTAVLGELSSHPRRIPRIHRFKEVVWELVRKSERHRIPILEYASFPESGHPAPGPSRPRRGFWLDSFCLGVHPTRSLSQYL
jgi:hypothetical protein